MGNNTPIVPAGSDNCRVLEAALAEGWRSRAELAALLMAHDQIGRSSAYLIVNRYTNARMEVSKVRIGQQMWATLRQGLPWTEEMCAEDAWGRLTKGQKMRLTKGISSVPKADISHAKLLGALAALGDEAAKKAFEELLCKTKTTRTPPKGLGNVLDVFTLGYKRAAQMEHCG